VPFPADAHGCAPTTNVLQVEQHLGPFLELGALDDLVINVVPPLEGQRQHMVQLSGIPDPPEGPVTLSQAKERIIAWARTRPAALQPGMPQHSTTSALQTIPLPELPCWHQWRSMTAIQWAQPDVTPGTTPQNGTIVSVNIVRTACSSLFNCSCQPLC
jgi:hypothetical protein